MSFRRILISLNELYLPLESGEFYPSRIQIRLDSYILISLYSFPFIAGLFVISREPLYPFVKIHTILYSIFWTFLPVKITRKSLFWKIVKLIKNCHLPLFYKSYSYNFYRTSLFLFHRFGIITFKTMHQYRFWLSWFDHICY